MHLSGNEVEGTLEGEYQLGSGALSDEEQAEADNLKERNGNESSSHPLIFLYIK
jgi:hypothetical protein